MMIFFHLDDGLMIVKRWLNDTWTYEKLHSRWIFCHVRFPRQELEDEQRKERALAEAPCAPQFGIF